MASICVAARHHRRPCSQTERILARIRWRWSAGPAHIICHHARHRCVVLANIGLCSHPMPKAKPRAGGCRRSLGNHVSGQVWPQREGERSGAATCIPCPFSRKRWPAQYFGTGRPRNSSEKGRRLGARFPAGCGGDRQKRWLPRTPSCVAAVKFHWRPKRA